MNVLKKVLLLTLAVGLLLSIQPQHVAASGGLRTVAFVGDTAPGTDVTFLDFIGDPSMNDNGQTAFHALLVGPGGRNAIFSEGGGHGLALIAREGDSVSGASLGETYGRLARPMINNNGQLLVHGGLVNTADFSNDEAIFSGDDRSGLLIVARQGDEVPGTNSGEKFDTPRSSRQSVGILGRGIYLIGSVFVLGGGFVVGMLSTPSDERQQEEAYDGTTAPPLVAYFLKVTQLAIGSLDVVVRANLFTCGAVEKRHHHLELLRREHLNHLR